MMKRYFFLSLNGQYAPNFFELLNREDGVARITCGTRGLALRHNRIINEHGLVEAETVDTAKEAYAAVAEYDPPQKPEDHADILELLAAFPTCCYQQQVEVIQ